MERCSPPRNTANVELSSQAGFALPGEPIFFARPKKTGEKKRRPITWPAALRAAGALCFSQSVGVADGPSWPGCNGFGIPASLGAARRQVHRLLRCSAT